MNKLFLFLLPVLLSSSLTKGQQYPSVLFTLTTNQGFKIARIIEDGNGDLITLGQPASISGPRVWSGAFNTLAKITASGTKVWQKTNRLADSSECSLIDILLTPSNQVWAVGVNSNLAYQYRIVTGNFDSNGNVLQAYRYLPNDTSTDILSTHVAQDINNDLWIFSVCIAQNPTRNGFHIMKTDLNGNILLQKYYLNNYLGWIVSAVPLSNGFILSGIYGTFAWIDLNGNFISGITTIAQNAVSSMTVNYMQSLPGGDVAVVGTTSFNGNYDVALMRMDSTGQQLFMKRYILPGQQEAGNLISTADSGFMFSIYHTFPTGDSAIIVKTDGNGNIEWARKKNSRSYFWWMEPVSSGRFCVGGFASSNPYKALFSIIDTSLMSQCFTDIIIPDSSYSYIDTILSLTLDTSVFVTMQPAGFLPVADFTISNDCFLSDAETIDEKNEMIKVYPNPFTQFISFSLPENLKSFTDVEIWSIQGELLQTFPVSRFMGNNKLFLEWLSPGLYVLKISNAFSNYRKLIVKQ